MSTTVNPASKLRTLISVSRPLQVMAAHSPLSARLAEEAGFEALWASGFELSALYGLPDISLVSMTEHLEMTRRIAGATSLPVVADIDTGFGNALNVIHAVEKYEQAGVAAVVIEDKTFPKVTSLADSNRQHLLRLEEFQGKIQAAHDARVNPDFVIIARTEALIAGHGETEALRRANAYAQAGADMILVHSKQSQPTEIVSFAEQWHVDVPLAVVPTSYPNFTPADARELGNIAVYIYGNHAIRATVAAMQTTFATIIAQQNMICVNDELAPVEEIFRLQRMEQMKANETAYLR